MTFRSDTRYQITLQPRSTCASSYKLWESTSELSGIAEDYLMTRHYYLPPKYGDLRWHPALNDPSGYPGPALVGLITGTHTNDPLSLHRTWITAIGKADVSPPRLPLANHTTRNGVTKLWLAEDVCGVASVPETF